MNAINHVVAKAVTSGPLKQSGTNSSSGIDPVTNCHFRNFIITILILRSVIDDLFSIWAWIHVCSSFPRVRQIQIYRTLVAMSQIMGGQHATYVIYVLIDFVGVSL